MLELEQSGARGLSLARQALSGPLTISTPLSKE